ncbi:hypothetical protein OE88DRAFT_931256 [Heliocybe sulcata]|uniref:Uncharacterized protein n=1 Tax=Heliocybe sulcata TaxID=5364 RepID=A0A5C3NBD2_9AGAM|nr:hypothetical protein OE88DRAFT_931256 [Heliocybe sulcata]
MRTIERYRGDTGSAKAIVDGRPRDGGRAAATKLFRFLGLGGAFPRLRRRRFASGLALAPATTAVVARDERRVRVKLLLVPPDSEIAHFFAPSLAGTRALEAARQARRPCNWNG